jgi:uncharacterized RDD family membrane protein YckC
MAPRTLSASFPGLDPELAGLTLASPTRRLSAFLLDCALLLLPSVAIAGAAVALSLWVTEPAALRATMALFSNQPEDAMPVAERLGALAPVLVRIQAPGLPPAVALAVEESDLERAGELLSEYSIDITLSPAGDVGHLEPGHIVVRAERLVPRGLRSAAMFGLAALYLTFLTSRRRAATIGKWLLGIRVRRLDGRPLTLWESFERFGGYMASLGTFGLGVLDFWRDANRRLAHDQISSTVVVRTSRGRRRPR